MLKYEMEHNEIAEFRKSVDDISKYLCEIREKGYVYINEAACVSTDLVDDCSYTMLMSALASIQKLRSRM